MAELKKPHRSLLIDAIFKLGRHILAEIHIRTGTHVPD